MNEENKKYLGESKIVGQPDKKLTIKIKDGAITTDKLAGQAVTPEKVSPRVFNELVKPTTDDLQHQINALDVAGLAVSNHFGDNEYIGVSQDTLTKAIQDIQESINNLHPGTIGVSLTANKSVVYKDATTNVTVTAAMVNNKNAETIILKEGSTVIEEGEDVSTLSHQIVVSDTTSFTVDAVQNGLSYSQSLTVSAAYPVYVGAGATYTSVVADASCKQTPRLTPKGTYTVTVGTAGHRVFFVVPSTMTINKATLSGFDFPLEMETATIEGVAYKVYKSNTLEAGTLTIVIS